MARRYPQVAALLAALTLVGCADLPYYQQAAAGQFELWQKSHPIEQWLADPQTSEHLRARLVRVQQIRAFASQALGLPDNQSYRGFADVQRPFLVWNVFAAPELTMTAKEWCFPIAGCVTYRGYFAEAPALTLARDLAADGYDTYVGGVPAYSTLGWFADPVPSTVIDYADIDLARLMFHELAHQVVYVPGDTTFNESFASMVEREGARRWTLTQGPASAREALEHSLTREARFTGLVLTARKQLTAVYEGTDDAANKRAAKRRILNALSADYAHDGKAWDPRGRYARWFAGPINNAQIAAVASYTERLPAFQAMLALADDDLTRFYAQVRDLGRLPASERRRRLDALQGPFSLDVVQLARSPRPATLVPRGVAP